MVYHILDILIKTKDSIMKTDSKQNGLLLTTVFYYAKY